MSDEKELRDDKQALVSLAIQRALETGLIENGATEPALKPGEYVVMQCTVPEVVWAIDELGITVEPGDIIPVIRRADHPSKPEPMWGYAPPDGSQDELRKHRDRVINEARTLLDYLSRNNLPQHGTLPLASALSRLDSFRPDPDDAGARFEKAAVSAFHAGLRGQKLSDEEIDRAAAHLQARDAGPVPPEAFKPDQCRVTASIEHSLDVLDELKRTGAVDRAVFEAARRHDPELTPMIDAVEAELKALRERNDALRRELSVLHDDPGAVMHSCDCSPERLAALEQLMLRMIPVLEAHRFDGTADVVGLLMQAEPLLAGVKPK